MHTRYNPGVAWVLPTGLQRQDPPRLWHGGLGRQTGVGRLGDGLARAIGVALAQAIHDISEFSERGALKKLLRSPQLEDVLKQANALHTTRPHFSGA